MSSQRPPAPRPAQPRPSVQRTSGAGQASQAAPGASTSTAAGPSRVGSTTPGPGLGGRSASRPLSGDTGTSALRRTASSGEGRSVLPSRSPSMRPSGPPGRGGGLSFRPTRPPPRRVQVKPDPDGPQAASPAGSPASSPAPPSFAQGRPRPQRPRNGPVMTASGPFGRGTEGSGSKGVASFQVRNEGESSRGAGSSSRSTAQIVKTEDGAPRRAHPDADDIKEREMYSDPEDDVQIVDMDEVSALDTLAPQSLPRMRQGEQRRTKAKVKREDGQAAGETPISADSSANVTPQPHLSASNTPDIEAQGKDASSRAADALDLDVSDEEEVMDDLLEDFVLDVPSANGFATAGPENVMYLFQFPEMFPRFQSATTDAATEGVEGEKRLKTKRSVVFADDTTGGGGHAGESPRATPGIAGVKDEAPGSSSKKRTSSASSSDSRPDLSTDESPRKSTSASRASSTRQPEGQIGRLDVYRDGRVLLCLGKDLVMDVTGGSQATFLQHAMLIDERNKRATTLGEVKRKFVVAPDIASMLADALDASAQPQDIILDHMAPRASLRDPEGMESLPLT